MRAWTFSLTAAAVGFTAPTTVTAQEYDATITRTTYGIAHIEADNWRSVGYGVAYAYAEDNICMLAEEFATVAGTRSLHFGPEGKNVLGFREMDNVSSDVFYRSQMDLKVLRENAQNQSSETRQLFEGYIAGYNRFLRDAGEDGLPEECRGKAWVKPLTYDDVLRLNEKQMLLASSLALAGGIANAAPPGEPQAALDLTFPAKDEPTFGSNGWAFGSEATADGRGLIIGNPHFPWEGPSRFWQMHVRGPDGYDVMGVGIAGTPIPTLGFNKDIAWTHTVTAARHFTVYALQLSPTDPTTYMVDGEPVKMEARTISVPVPDGAEPITRTLYSTQFGPVITLPGSGVEWSKQLAFALRDANSGNQRALDAWLGIGRARNVGEIEDAVSDTLGIPWVNTIAADREGNALHADITVVPNVTKELIQVCSTPFTAMVASQVTLLDGSRKDCDWKTRETTAPYPGLLPAESQASRTRRDYVTNSNDSYWLSHAGEPYRELSPILGEYRKALSLRTRSNFKETENSLAEANMDHERAKALTFGNKSLAADMVVDDALGMCTSFARVADACSALAQWDRQFEADSRGAYLFVKFWNKVRNRSDLWEVPFDPEDPLNTPSGYVKGQGNFLGISDALKEAAEEIKAASIALDAPWGEVQVRLAGDDRIAIHGGPGTAGVLNMQRSRPIEGGLTPVHGSSYIQIVSFDEDGPIAEAILSYSQSTNPASPHYADQTRAYAEQNWHRLPFSDDEIAAARIGEPIRLTE
ncbi:penicillin acylase family protein [Erythrobacter sp. YT30]|uniref:penicillin acylase family protein n=1 Tax=Erythrobacter sp. YT30 TaxID=1735012 RepID=UPI00076D1C8E|nr:penicillin acylase family protein [Erythrobacter sp. YT30]KWV92942.1 acyl-homoserine-lactone acylase [Erythrobacter sp. YT30]